MRVGTRSPELENGFKVQVLDRCKESSGKAPQGKGHVAVYIGDTVVSKPSGLRVEA